MNYSDVLNTLTAIGTIGAVAVGMIAIEHANKNNKQQIIIHKLEELYETVQLITLQYGRFMSLYHKIQDMRTGNSTIKTLADYYTVRDQELPATERHQIVAYFSRLEVLKACYTRDSLFKELEAFEKVMFPFADLVFNGGSILQELHWPMGFPKYEEFYKQTEDLKKSILKEINIAR